MFHDCPLILLIHIEQNSSKHLPNIFSQISCSCCLSLQHSDNVLVAQHILDPSKEALDNDNEDDDGDDAEIGREAEVSATSSSSILASQRFGQHICQDWPHPGHSEVRPIFLRTTYLSGSLPHLPPGLRDKEEIQGRRARGAAGGRPPHQERPAAAARKDRFPGAPWRIGEWRLGVEEQPPPSFLILLLLYLSPKIWPQHFPRDQKNPEVAFASPLHFLGEISPMY